MFAIIQRLSKCTKTYLQYTKWTEHPPHRPIFTSIKLNWVRWPDSGSVRTQCKSRTMKTSPKKAESATVLLIQEQLWAGRMWKGQKGSCILHMNLWTCCVPDCRTVCDYKLRCHAPPAAEQTHGCRVKCAAVPAGEDDESIKNVHMPDWPCQERFLNDYLLVMYLFCCSQY